MKLREYIDWKFTLMWAEAIVISYLLMQLLSSFTNPLGMPNAKIIFIGAYNGALLGFAQWLLLQNRIDRAGWWVAIMIFIWAFEVYWLTHIRFTEAVTAITVTLEIATVLLTGVLQMLVLHAQAYKPWVWIITLLIAYGLKASLEPVTIIGLPPAIFGKLFYMHAAVIEGLLGLLTGAVMSWMLNHDNLEPALTKNAQ